MASSPLRDIESDRLYEQYGKPLETDHWGEFLAVSPQGETVIAGTLLEVAQRALAAFGPGSFVFKIGDKVVGGWRQATGV